MASRRARQDLNLSLCSPGPFHLYSSHDFSGASSSQRARWPQVDVGAVHKIGASSRRYNSRELMAGLSLGARLGPYQVLAAIGAGGMGEVYRARDSKLGRDVPL